jgi:hypothetical protein
MVPQTYVLNYFITFAHVEHRVQLVEFRMDYTTVWWQTSWFGFWFFHWIVLCLSKYPRSFKWRYTYTHSLPTHSFSKEPWMLTNGRSKKLWWALHPRVTRDKIMYCAFWKLEESFKNDFSMKNAFGDRHV